MGAFRGGRRQLPLMRVRICAVGRMKSGPERVLVDDYTTRFDRTGRALGLGPLTISEVDDRKCGGMAAEAALLDRAIPDGAVICAMDERGREMTSPDFAQMLAGWRDQGRAEIAFVIGGATGSTPPCASVPMPCSPSGRWSGRTCWCARCCANSSTARPRSSPDRPITGSDPALVDIAAALPQD